MNDMTTPATVPPEVPPEVLAQRGWTEDRVAWLRTLVGAGMGAAEIAQAIGVTRNAVIGKVGRLLDLHLMIPWPGAGHRRQRKARTGDMASARTPGRERSRLANKIASGTFARAPKPIPKPIPKPVPMGDLVASVSRNVKLMDLEAYDCRWAHGERPFLFCGRRTSPGSSWCEYHARLVFVPATPRQQRQRLA